MVNSALKRRLWRFYAVSGVLTVLAFWLFVHAVNVWAERKLCFSDWLSQAQTMHETTEEIVEGCKRAHPFLYLP